MDIGAILGTYIIIQFWANTMGLTVIFVLDNVIDRALKDRGYTSIPVTASDKVRKIGMGIIKFNIPFYYCIVAIDLVTDNSSFEHIINEKIKNGEYIVRIVTVKPKLEETLAPPLKVEPLSMVKEHYKANNYASLYTNRQVEEKEFSGSLNRPLDTNISPFAKAEVLEISETDEIASILSKLNSGSVLTEEEKEKIAKALKLSQSDQTKEINNSLDTYRTLRSAERTYSNNIYYDNAA